MPRGEKGPPRENIRGLRVGKLVAVRHSHKRGPANIWLLRCDCGGVAFAAIGDFKRGRPQSCGCETATLIVAKTTKHGLSRSPEYAIWAAMKYRCSKHGPQGQGRYHFSMGVRVCQKWRRSFGAFLADVGPRPSPRHSIDRFPDTNGDYEPGNVRWATPSQQQENRRDRAP